MAAKSAAPVGLLHSYIQVSLMTTLEMKLCKRLADARKATAPNSAVLQNVFWKWLYTVK